ncbi:MAG TPA: TetR/AcrR family transcriptional regulator [bacterium]|mgnify:CR=1 FL=1|nr:TetR/AcrR family transcriptional regulator [bacterium]
MPRTPKKKQQIVEAAREMFLRHGVRRVSVEEICRKAGVSKMTFYRYYEDKLALAEEFVRELCRETLVFFEDALKSGAPVEQVFEQIIAFKETLAERVGPALFEELYNPSSPLWAMLEELKREGLRRFLQFFAARQRSGELRKDIRPEFVLAMVDKMRELAQDKQLLSLYRNRAEMAREINAFFFYGIVDRPAPAGGRRKRK